MLLFIVTSIFFVSPKYRHFAGGVVRADGKKPGLPGP